jgi:tRNA(Ser,Leu) C12 N-acetylase TAN1
MELKLARTELDTKPKKIELKKIESMLEKEESVILYFDRDNSHKDLLELQDHFEEAGKMKSSAGETFAERIKAGKLPAAK